MDVEIIQEIANLKERISKLEEIEQKENEENEDTEEILWPSLSIQVID